MNVRIVDDARALPRDARGRTVVIGNFDGVHRGHREVLAKARDASERRDLVVLTFEPHPAAVLGASAPPKLTRLSRKAELLADAGASIVVAQRFDGAFASLAPARFVDEILVDGLAAKRVVVGHDFRFGAKRAGDLDALRALGDARGFDVSVQEVVADDRGPLSSTRVREALARGDLDDVERVLGRPHAIEGVVVTGDRRGRTLGFPTANLAEIEEALPAHGVYAILADRARDDATTFRAFARGVANVGVRPTLPARAVSIEAHLFDLPAADSDLYGDRLRLHLVARIREERRFPGLDALRAQITADAERARAILSPFEPPSSRGWW